MHPATYFFFSPAFSPKSHDQPLSLFSPSVTVILHPPRQTCCDFFSSCAICLISHSNSSNRSARPSSPESGELIHHADRYQLRLSSRTEREEPRPKTIAPPAAAGYSSNSSTNTTTPFHKRQHKCNYTCESVFFFFLLQTEHRRRPYIIRTARSGAVFDPDNVTHVPDEKVFFLVRKFSGDFSGTQFFITNQMVPAYGSC